MKTKVGILVLVLCATFIHVQAQRTVATARATSYDISDNLDLEAVASIFAESENLEDFEYRLNNPDNRISNLDLNQDGYIDYLRVIETSSDRNSLVVVQAVLDEDVYQDVATIDIERDRSGNHRVQIVGDSYIYGPDYIIEPVFYRTPLIFSFFWSPRYISWHSPYYWGYYPDWYSYYRPYPTFRYYRHVNSYINQYNTYHYTTERYINYSGDRYNRIRRSDYATRYPDRAFERRNHGVSNRNELIERRPSNSVNRRSTDIRKENSRQYERRESSSPRRTDSQRKIYENKRSGQTNQPGSNQMRTRENKSVSPGYEKRSSGSEKKSYERRPSGSDNRDRIQNKPAYRNESSGKPSVSKSHSSPAPNRTSPRVEPTRRSSAPREKSGSVSQGRSSGAKQSPQNVRKSGSSKKEADKESGNGRRR